MKKNTYIRPETTMVGMESVNMMATSVNSSLGIKYGGKASEFDLYDEIDANTNKNWELW